MENELTVTIPLREYDRLKEMGNTNMLLFNKVLEFEQRMLDCDNAIKELQRELYNKGVL